MKRSSAQRGLEQALDIQRVTRPERGEARREAQRRGDQSRGAADRRDVVVIGGGAIGCATAWELARRGARVTLLERGSPGREATWAAAGMLSPLGEAARDDAYLAFSSAALDRYAGFAEALEAATGEDIEYRTNGKLYVALDEAERPAVDRLIDRGAAFGVERLDGDRARALEPALAESVAGAVLVRRDHRVDNRRLGAALAAAATAAGVDIREHTLVREIRTHRTFPHSSSGTVTSTDPIAAGRGQTRRTSPHPSGGRSGGGRPDTGGQAVREVTLDNGTSVRADAVVVAAGAWSGQLHGLPRPIPVRPVRGQMFAVSAAQTGRRHRYQSPLPLGRRGEGQGEGERLDAPLLERVVMTSDCYIIPRANGTVLVGATVEDVGFAPGPTPCGIRTLAAAASAAIPAIGELPIVETWAGYRPGTPDGLPILGVDPDVDGLYYATGHFRSGILLAPITAEIIADLITGATPAIDTAPFSVQRFRSSH